MQDVVRKQETFLFSKFQSTKHKMYVKRWWYTDKVLLIISFRLIPLKGPLSEQHLPQLKQPSGAAEGGGAHLDYLTSLNLLLFIFGQATLS